MPDHALADAIRRARLRNDLTQQEVADQLGVSRGLVAAWETGRSEPTDRVFAEMKRLLGRIRREYGRDGDGSPDGDERRGRPRSWRPLPRPAANTPATRAAAPSPTSPSATAAGPGEVPETPRATRGRSLEPARPRDGARRDGGAVDIYHIATHLWEAADELRANSHLKAGDYSIPVLGLIFLRFAETRFSALKAELDQRPSGRREYGKEDYQAKGVLYLPAKARYTALLSLPQGENVGRALNEAMAAIEAENPDLAVCCRGPTRSSTPTPCTVSCG